MPATYTAIEAIRIVKARYWRGVDTRDSALVRSILAPDCVLDYRNCGVDPASGIDYLPEMAFVMNGRDNWPDAGKDDGNPDKPTIITAHHGHQHEITMTSYNRASAIWAFSDRLFFLNQENPRRVTGYGHYHDTYRCENGVWLLESIRITRLWVEGGSLA